MANRKAKLELSFKAPAGQKRKRVAVGGVFEGKYPGSYDVSFSVAKEGGDGWERITALKTESGRKLDIADAFMNLVVYEPLDARPPYDGPGASKPKGESKSFDENF